MSDYIPSLITVQFSYKSTVFKKKKVKTPLSGNLNIHSLNRSQVTKEITTEITKYLKLNDNENNTRQNLQETVLTE